MRILHTADWHLHERLKRVARRPHLVKRLEEIAGYLDERQVDVMVVAGDLFSQGQRMEELSQAVSDIQRIFKPFLLKGGTIVAISGNHDNEHVFNFMRNMLDLAVPIDARVTGPRPPGRLYLASRPTVLELADPARQSVQFVLLPYPTPARYLSEDKTSYESLAKRNELLHRKFEETRDRILNSVIKKHIRSVLVSHIHVRGTQVYTRHHVSESDDVVIDQGEIPAYLDYAAYGHIHEPGEVLRNTPHVRYAGSIERMNYGERKDGKSVVRASYGMFYSHPLLALAFDSAVADGTQAPQLAFFGTSTPCTPASVLGPGPGVISVGH